MMTSRDGSASSAAGCGVSAGAIVVAEFVSGCVASSVATELVQPAISSVVARAAARRMWVVLISSAASVEHEDVVDLGLGLAGDVGLDLGDLLPFGDDAVAGG